MKGIDAMSDKQLLDVYTRRLNHNSLTPLDELDTLKRLISLLSRFKSRTWIEWFKKQAKLFAYHYRQSQLKKIL